MSPETITDPSHTTLSQVTLAVIAGGKGERMGIPKSRLTIRSEPILQYLLRRMEWPGPTILVTAPGVEHPPSAELFAREVIDPIQGLGPLNGLLTALENSATPILACIAVDMVAVNRTMVVHLVTALTADAEALGVMYRTTNEKHSGTQPFPSVFRREAREEIHRRIARGQMSVHDLIEAPGFKLVEPPKVWPSILWTNINSPDDLVSFETSQQSASSSE